MYKIVLVGETNICRSFMAESILRGILKKRKCTDITVISRGLVVLFSEPVAPKAAVLLKEKGYKMEDYHSSQLEEADLADADLVLTLTAEQAERVKESYKDLQVSCMSIGTFIDMDEDIPEVAEEAPETYQKCFQTLEQLMEAVADRIIGEVLV